MGVPNLFLAPGAIERRYAPLVSTDFSTLYYLPDETLDFLLR